MKSINPEKSLEYFKDAIRLDPLNKDLYLNKGILLFKLNVIKFIYLPQKYDLAKSDFKKCLKLDENEETARDYLRLIIAEEERQLHKYSSSEKIVYEFNRSDGNCNHRNRLPKN